MNSPCVLDVGLGTVYPLSNLTHTFNQLYLHFTDKKNLRLRRVMCLLHDRQLISGVPALLLRLPKLHPPREECFLTESMLGGWAAAPAGSSRE